MSPVNVAMRANLVRRRSSSSLSAQGANSTRRSSINQRDIDYIQTILSRTRHVSDQIIIAFIIIAPALIHFYYPFVSSYHGRICKIHKLHIAAFLPSFNRIFPYAAVGFTIILQFLFFWLLPASSNVYLTHRGKTFRQNCNAFSAILLNALIFGLGSAFKLYSPTAMFEQWTGVMMVLGGLCVFLVFWQYFTEVNEDETDDFLNEMFFGKVSQPVVLEMDLKAFLTNRVLGSLYVCYLFSALAKQRITVGVNTPGFICTMSLQLVYWLRRSWSDPCRPSSLDNQQDKFGLLRLYGGLVFLPTLYLTPVTLLAQSTKTPSPTACVVIFVFGFTAQSFTWSIDNQRLEFRKYNGQMKVDEKDPYYIAAKYRREGGEAATNLLLGSGYWGRARHLNYTTELISFVMWTFPLKFNFAVGYVPILFLAIFLHVRACRDEVRCLLKYQSSWIQYTNKVRYMFVPSVY